MKKLMSVLLMMSLLSFVSCGGNNSELPGVDGPNLTVQDGVINFDVELINVLIDGEIEYANSAVPNSYFKLTTGDKGGLELQGVLNYGDIANGDFPAAQPETLPGGRPFPGLGTPELYKMEVPGNAGSYLYANKNIFAVWIPTGYDNTIGLRSNIEVGGKQYGYAALVPNDSNGENSGVVVVLQLNRSNKKLLRKILRYSKRHPNKVIK